MNLRLVLLVVGILAISTQPLRAQTDAFMEKKAMKAPKQSFSPYANRSFPTNVYFGDTHLHTALSMDAGTFGNRLGLEPAYRYCRGEEVISSTGYRARLSRPLDFVVIADHSDGMGVFDLLRKGDPKVVVNEQTRRWHEGINKGGAGGGRHSSGFDYHVLSRQDAVPDQRPEALPPCMG